MAYRSTTSITDEELLELIHSGFIEVDLTTCEVRCKDRIRKPGTVGTEGKNGTRNRIEIRYDGRKRSIVLGRLVYIAGTRKVIPDGFEVHHLDGDRYNDEFENLVALSVSDHLKIHRFMNSDPYLEPDAEEMPF